MTEYIETEWIDSQVEAYTKWWGDPRFVVGDHVVNHAADWSLDSLTGHVLALEWWKGSEE